MTNEMLTPEDISRFRALFYKYCRGEINANRCEAERMRRSSIHSKTMTRRLDMHGYIYELSSDPIPEEERYSNTDLPDWFHGSISDGTSDINAEERVSAIESLLGTLAGNCTYEDGKLQFTDNVKERYFRGSFAEFKEAAALLSAASYEVFSGQEKSTEFAKAMVTIRFAYEDKFDHYIYLKDNDELVPLDAWVRDLDPKDSFFIGGIIDYHW